MVATYIFFFYSLEKKYTIQKMKFHNKPSMLMQASDLIYLEIGSKQHEGHNSFMGMNILSKI